MAANNKHANSIYQRNVIMAVISAVVLAVDIVLMVLTYNRAVLNMQPPLPFAQCAFDAQSVGKPTYIDAVSTPLRIEGKSLFASKLYDIYLVSDGSGTYVVSLQSTRIKYIEKDIAKDGSKQLVGCVCKLSKSELGSIEKQYPGVLPDGTATKLYASYKTDLYHMLMGPPYNFTVYLAILLTSFIMLAVSLYYASSFGLLKGSGADAAEAEAEMNAPDAVWLKELNCYICKTMLVGINSGVNTIKYEDIAMIFCRAVSSVFGIAMTEELCIADKHGKIRRFGVFIRTVKTDADIEKLNNAAKAANPDIVIGYDKKFLNTLKKQK